MSYDEAVDTTWHSTEGPVADFVGLQRELVRYATLAPSSHNTQCWKFALQERGISILPDLSRRCPAVDPDDHHLFVSLGCAAENLIVAARAHGLMGEVELGAPAPDALSISLAPTKAVVSPLFEAIPNRQCTRAEFDGRPLSNAELKLLEHAGTGSGTHLLLLTDDAAVEQVLEFVVQANIVQLHDSEFMEELRTWIRFSDAEAVRTRDGLFSRTTGNPSVPQWLGSLLLNTLLTADNENEKYATHVRSSAGIAVFVSESNDKASWVNAGRCYERFALQATALGIRTAFLNQPVEVAAMRPQFARFLGVERHRPDLVVRFGRGPAMPRSLRRPVGAVVL